MATKSDIGISDETGLKGEMMKNLTSKGNSGSEFMLPSFTANKQKGMANIIYIMGLILMCIISLAYIVPFLSQQPEKNVVEIAVNNYVYLMRDSVEMAKLYLDNAARYSLYQAMYENGRDGGFESTEKDNQIEYDAINYRLWYNNTDTAPTESDITDALEEAFEENFEKYTKDQSVTGLFAVGIPRYNKITITNANNYSLRLEGTGTADLSVGNTMESGERIAVEKSSLINMTVHAPYYKLYQEALEFHKALEEKLLTCDKAAIEKTTDKSSYTLDVKVLDTDDGSCLVRVNVSSKKKFLVWNGTNTTLEEIDFVFLERLGTVVERCTGCLNSPGSWCVQSKKCSKNSVDIDCPHDSTISISSCRALGQVTCRECMENAKYLGELFWVWCPDENVCADKCAGRTVYNAEEC